MKRSLTLSLVILFSYSLTLCLSPRALLISVIQQLLRKPTFGQQLELIYLLKETSLKEFQSWTGTLKRALSALNARQKDRPKPLSDEAFSVVNEARDRFGEAPGFQKTLFTLLRNLNNEGFTRGYLYELEVALALDHQGNTVRRFGAIRRAGSLCREFDLITDTHWIECKNITWACVPVDGNKKWARHLKEQFLEQRSIVANYNRKHGKNITYAVCSKNEIPLSWQFWFKKHSIDFTCLTYDIKDIDAAIEIEMQIIEKSG